MIPESKNPSKVEKTPKSNGPVENTTVNVQCLSEEEKTLKEQLWSLKYQAYGTVQLFSSEGWSSQLWTQFDAIA